MHSCQDKLEPHKDIARAKEFEPYHAWLNAPILAHVHACVHGSCHGRYVIFKIFPCMSCMRGCSMVSPNLWSSWTRWTKSWLRCSPIRWPKFQQGTYISISRRFKSCMHVLLCQGRTRSIAQNLCERHQSGLWDELVLGSGKVMASIYKIPCIYNFIKKHLQLWLRAWKAPETEEEKAKKAASKLEKAEKAKLKKDKEKKRKDEVKSENDSDEEEPKFLDCNSMHLRHAWVSTFYYTSMSACSTFFWY